MDNKSPISSRVDTWKKNEVKEVDEMDKIHPSRVIKWLERGSGLWAAGIGEHVREGSKL
jgi:hypothetical protein